jgi:hypothetical protein
MAETAEDKDAEQADSQMIAEQIARVTLNMIHTLYGTDRVRFRRMSHLILDAIVPALTIELKNDDAFTNICQWRMHRQHRQKLP